MSYAIFRTMFATTAFIAASTVAQMDIFGNWDILFQSLETDFRRPTDNEFTFDYLIGKGRAFKIDLFDKGCTDPITGMTISHTGNADNFDANYDWLEVKVDLDKTGITLSNIWTDPKLQFCVRVQLLSQGSVINEE
jgi:hypothetical protein